MTHRHHETMHASAVHDAMYEAAFTRPDLAGADGRLSSAALRDALAWIPDEHRRPGSTLAEQFVASVLANAQAAGRTPYALACFALDI